MTDEKHKVELAIMSSLGLKDRLIPSAGQDSNSGARGDLSFVLKREVVPTLPQECCESGGGSCDTGFFSPQKACTSG